MHTYRLHFHDTRVFFFTTSHPPLSRAAPLLVSMCAAHLPEVPDGYELSIGAENFLKILDTWGGPTARADWEKLSVELRPLSKGVMTHTAHTVPTLPLPSVPSPLTVWHGLHCR
jgi:hypothetical protein